MQLLQKMLLLLIDFQNQKILCPSKNNLMQHMDVMDPILYFTNRSKIIIFYLLIVLIN